MADTERQFAAQITAALFVLTMAAFSRFEGWLGNRLERAISRKD